MNILLSQRPTEQRERRIKGAVPHVSPVPKFSRERAKLFYNWYVPQLQTCKPCARWSLRQAINRLELRIDYLEKQERWVEVFSQ
jgi:hypothetical protein